MIRKILTTALISASFISHSSVAQESVDPEALFEDAMQYREDGELFNAIEIFETILSNQPELNRARLELAVSYHLSRRYEAARAELTRVLNDPDTPESVKLTITAYLAQLSGDMQAAQQRSRSSIYLSVGLFSDSNINLGPDSQTIANETLVSAGSVVKENSHGGQLLLSFSNRSRASEPLAMAGRAVDFEWLTQATAYNKSYAADAGDSDFNLSVLSLSTGPALIADRAWRTALNFKMDKVFFGNDPYALFAGFNPLFTYSFMPDLELTLENTTTIKEYEDKSLDDTLKGTATIWGMDLAKFYSKLNIGIQAGIKRHDNGAKADFRRYTGTEVYLGGQMPAWENARAYLTVSSRDYRYKGADTDANFMEKRDETELLAVLGVNHNFTSGDFKSWTLNAQLTYADNDSNLDAFDYDRNVFEVNMRRYFF